MSARRFFFILLLVVALGVLIDLGIGAGFDYLQQRATGGDTARHHYINRKSQEDIMIFGSSRAIHHYDPRVLEQRLGMTAYNCGADGQGILMHYMQLTNILERHTPRVVVWDIYDEFDYLSEPDLSKYLYWERAYYGKGNAALDSVFHDVNSAERLKMLSNAYRYNFRFMQMLSDNIHPNAVDFKGFRPYNSALPGVFDGPPTPHTITGEKDSIKLEYIRRFAEKCHERDITLIVAVSPYFYGSAVEQFPQPIKSWLTNYRATILDFSNDPEFIGRRDYFRDTNHLQLKGAKVLTLRVAEVIDSLQKSDNQVDKK